MKSKAWEGTWGVRKSNALQKCGSRDLEPRKPRGGRAAAGAATTGEPEACGSGGHGCVGDEDGD